MIEYFEGGNMSIHQKPDGRWYVSYRDDHGNQHIKVFGRGDAAKKLAKSFDYEIKSHKSSGREIVGPSGVYFDDLAQSYVKHSEANGRSERWLKELVNLLNKKIIPFLSSKPVDRLESTDILKVVEHLGDISQTTKNRYIDYLRSIFRFGLKHRLTHKNPLEHWSKNKEKPRQSLLTIDDLKKIYDKAEPHLKWIIEVQWNLGTRPGASELLRIQWDHIDFERNIVRVYASKTKSWREIPIKDEFRDRLLYMKRSAKTQFIIEYNGKPINKIRRSFKTACKKACILYDVRMYDLRHLFASALLSGGGDLAAVSKLLGHSSTKMTSDVYYHLLHGEKRRAVNLLPSINNIIANESQ
jgi:integrase